ncbi:hypothetical protein D3C87_1973960 [compost metagenome]
MPLPIDVESTFLREPSALLTIIPPPSVSGSRAHDSPFRSAMVESGRGEMVVSLCAGDIGLKSED